MGKLAQLQHPTKDVEAYKGQKLTFRGLSLRDVSGLMVAYGDAFRAIYDETIAPIIQANAVAAGKAGGAGATSAAKPITKKLPKGTNVIKKVGKHDPPVKAAPRADDDVSAPVVNENGQVEQEVSVVSLIQAIVKTAPDAVADIIAIANDSYHEDGSALADQLPATVQIACVKAIAELTFANEHSSKKMSESLLSLLEQAGLKDKIVPPAPTT